MTGGHPNARHQADRRADPVIARAIELGYLDKDEPFDVPMPTHAAANEGRLSVNRSARRQNLSPGAWVANQQGEPCYPPCAEPEAPHYTRFRLWSKERARTHVFRQTGGDPAKLKYNPWTSHRTPRYDDQGRSGLLPNPSGNLAVITHSPPSMRYRVRISPTISNPGSFRSRMKFMPKGTISARRTVPSRRIT